MKIRPANEADLADLAELITRSIRTLNAADESPEDIAYVCAKHDVHHLQQHLLSREIFVLDVNGRLTGTASLKADRLHSLFVESNLVGKGYGRSLVNHIENLARSKQISTLKLSSSRTAVPFYEKLGFQKLHFEPREFAPTWAMEKRL